MVASAIEPGAVYRGGVSEIMSSLLDPATISWKGKNYTKGVSQDVCNTQSGITESNCAV